jgi:hypothetical protein
MKRHEIRHYTEEEILMHLLGEEAPEIGSIIEAHLPKCSECQLVFQDFVELERSIHSWMVEDLSEESWEGQKTNLLDFYRQDASSKSRKKWMPFPFHSLQVAWEYALEHPIPAILYVAAAIAFSTERAIDVFRLQEVLPAANQVIEILRQVL